MAASVTYSDGKAREIFSGEIKLVYWESPATMDSADYFTPSAITGKTIRIVNAWDHSTGDAITATVSSGVITLDAAGGTTDHSYGVWFAYMTS